MVPRKIEGLHQLGPKHWLSEDENRHRSRLSRSATGHHSIKRRVAKSVSMRKVKITLPKLNLPPED